MGLWDELDAVPQVHMQGGVVCLNGRRRLTVDFAPDSFGPFGPRWLSQPGLLEMLIEAGGHYPGFDFRRRASVNALIREGDRFVGIRGKGPEGDFEVRADLVIGADGRTSIIRRRAELPEHTARTPMDIVWLKLPPLASLRDSPRLTACLGRGHLLVAAPVYDDMLQLGWIIEKGRFGDLSARGIPACLDDMAALAPPDLAEHIRRHRDDAVQPFLLATASDRVTEWTRPGLLVIGDAAHTMSPVGAQGLNIAIRDAVVAANHLVPVLAGEPAPAAVDAATKAIEAERAPEAIEVQRLQAKPPVVVLRDLWWSHAVLQLVIGAVGLLPAGLLARGFRRIGSGTTEVKLHV